MNAHTPNSGSVSGAAVFENHSAREPESLPARPVVSASVCSICLEQLASAGTHQLCCLRCGHIFGRSCLERWLRHQRRALDRCCPECKQRASLKDIRLLYLPFTDEVQSEAAVGNYAKSAECSPPDFVWNAAFTVRLAAKELDEREELRKSLQLERKRRVEMELELCRLRDELDSLQNLRQAEMKRVRSEYASQISRAARPLEQDASDRELSSVANRNASNVPATMQSLGITSCGQTRCLLQRARVALLHAGNRHLYVSTASRAPKASHGTESYTLKEIPLELVSSPVASSFDSNLHKAAIRDIASNERLLACASLDGSVSLVQPQTLLSVASIPVGEPAWSVRFTANWDHGLAIGSQRGRLLFFDLRQTREPLGVFGAANPPGGVHSIHLGVSNQVNHDLLAFCTLRSLFVTQFSPSLAMGTHELVPQDLSNLFPKPAQLYCMRIHDNYLMLSRRFGSMNSGEHVLVHIDYMENQFTLAGRATGFDPGPLLGRTDFCLVQQPLAPRGKPMPLLLSGDAGHLGKLRCWTPDLFTEPQNLTLFTKSQAAVDTEATPSVFVEQSLGMFAAVTSNAVSLFRWNP